MDGPAPKDDAPIPGQQNISRRRTPRKDMPRIECGNQRQSDVKEVKRPDAQNTPQIKSLHIQRATNILLTQHQFCDQIGAENKKQVNPEHPAFDNARTRNRDRSWNTVLRIIFRRMVEMKKKHRQKRKKTEHIELRPVERPFLRRSALYGCRKCRGCHQLPCRFALWSKEILNRPLYSNEELEKRTRTKKKGGYKALEAARSSCATSANNPLWRRTSAASQIVENCNPDRSAISRSVCSPSDKFRTHRRALISVLIASPPLDR